MMNSYEEEDLFTVFHREIIQHKEDTRNQRWKYKCEKVVSDITNHEINLISPKNCIFQVALARNGNPAFDIMQELEDLENAFYCISQYAINLCRDPHRTEYKIIKTYTGYYASNILSVMEGTDMDIIKSMGYEIKDSCENNDEFVLRSPTQSITRLAFELFLAQPYCRRVKQLCLKVHDKYPKDAITSMLECDIKKIIQYGADRLCDEWLYGNKPRKTESHHSSYQHSHANSDYLTGSGRYGLTSVEATNLDNVSENDYRNSSNQFQQLTSRDNNSAYHRENPIYESSGPREQTGVTKKSSLVKIRVNYNNETNSSASSSIGESTVKGDASPRNAHVDNVRKHREEHKNSSKVRESATLPRGNIDGRVSSGNNTPTEEFQRTYPDTFIPKLYQSSPSHQ